MTRIEIALFQGFDKWYVGKVSNTNSTIQGQALLP